MNLIVYLYTRLQCVTHLRLEVPVHDALEVHEVDGGHELGHDARGLRLVEATFPTDPVQQLAALRVRMT